MRGAQDVADDHHLLVVPAIDERARDRAEQQVRERGREEDEAGRQRRAGRDRDDRDQRELIEPVAEQRDELAGPQRRERAVEREPDVRVLADALDRAGRGTRSRDRDVAIGRRAASPPTWSRASKRRASDGEARPAPGAAHDERPLEGDGAGQGRRQAGLGAAGRRPRRGAAVGAATSGRAAARMAASSRLVELLRDADDRGEQEEGEAERQEGVADRRHVLDDRQRDRDDVGERPEVEQEVRVERRAAGRSGAPR